MSVDATKEPTIERVINQSRWFCVKPNEFIEAYLEKVENGWNGYKIELKHLHTTGFFWEMTPFFSSLLPPDENITSSKNG